MKYFVAAIIIIGLSLGAWQIYQYLGHVQNHRRRPLRRRAPGRTGEELSGLPSALEPAWAGADSMARPACGNSWPLTADAIKDPRRASIELDYVVLARGEQSRAKPAGFLPKCKERLTPESPVYDRMKKLEKTYE